MRRTLITRRSLAATLALAAGPRTAAAKDLVDPVNKNRSGIALKGYDAVAYHTESKPVKGSAQFTHSWMGATWQFASAENRDRFAAAPEKYAPQFGGYCAWAVGHNYTASIDPEAWTIDNGKLYLNYSKGVQKDWMKDQQKWIAEGEKNWPGLRK